MGKGEYLGGHTILSMYDKEQHLIKKIYRALYDDLKKHHINFLSIKNCFADYELEEVLEAAEFNLPEKEKFLDRLIEYQKKYNKNGIFQETTEEIKSSTYTHFSQTKLDLIEGLEYDLKRIQKKIEKYPTNNSLKKEKSIIIEKIRALKNNGEKKNSKK